MTINHLPTLADHWRVFHSLVLAAEDMDDNERVRMRSAFFSGALAAVQLHKFAACQPPADAIAVLDALQSELDEFTRYVRAKAAAQH